MGMSAGPDVVEDGLVMALDAANTRSYPGSGSTWFDISGNNHNATLNSVTHSSVNGGVFVTAGSLDSYIDNNTINLASTNFTVFCASRYSGSSYGRIVNARNNNFLVGHHGSYPERYYAGSGWIQQTTTSQNSTDWRIYHACGNISGDSYDFYIDERTIETGDASGSAGPNGLLIGKSPYSSEASTGHCAFVYYYNRVLTKDETLQNFHALRGRFGL